MSRPDYERLLDAAIDDLGWLRRNYRIIDDEARKHSGNGYRSQNFEPTGRGHSISDPTAQAVTSEQADYIRRAWQRMNSGILELSRKAYATRDSGAFLLPLPPDEARRLADLEHAKTSTCENCGRTIAGTEADRIRSGRCHSCYVYRKRRGVDRPVDKPEGETP